MPDRSHFENLHDLRIPVELTDQYLGKEEVFKIKEDDLFLTNNENKTTV
jgi:hypothetical protein